MSDANAYSEVKISPETQVSSPLHFTAVLTQGWLSFTTGYDFEQIGPTSNTDSQESIKLVSQSLVDLVVTVTDFGNNEFELLFAKNQGRSKISECVPVKLSTEFKDGETYAFQELSKVTDVELFYSLLDKKFQQFILDFTKNRSNQGQQREQSKLQEQLDSRSVATNMVNDNRQSPKITRDLPSSGADYVPPPTKPIPAGLAAPKFDDEYEIQRSDPQSQLPGIHPSGYGERDLNPPMTGRYPEVKPYLDPLSNNGSGGMYPTATDPLFHPESRLRETGLSGRLQGGTGIRYDDPLLGPDDDLNDIGSGLPGGMGLPGRMGGRRNFGPGGGSGFGNSGGFGGGFGGPSGGFGGGFI